MKRVLPVLALLASILTAARAEGVMVERIRYVGTVAYSRIVVDLSEATRYSVMTVPAHGPSSLPERLVIDVPSAVIGPEAREPLAVGDALVRGIRTGQFDAGTARIVVDLTRSAAYQVFTLPDPYRMVIDFRAEEAPRRPATRVVRADSADETAGAKVKTVPSVAETRHRSGAVATDPPDVPRGARTTQAQAQSPVPPPVAAAKRLKVMIDPGHGGKDPGAYGLGGVVEKEVVLSVSHMLATRLKSDTTFDVFLTRRDDRYLTLEERTALANAVSADLFVSIHANASPRREARGIEVYYLNNTHNRGTLRLAAMENDLRWDPRNPTLQDAIPDLSYILSDLRQTYKVEESRVLAEEIGRAAVLELGERYSDVQNLGAKEGPFYVLVGAYMPCVLVELSFLTNPTEAARLNSRDYQETLAEGIFDGIQRYVTQTRMAKNL
ncbi:MAG: N-acetylmuramoyl-L-alanine amidase [Candidatus Binatota bacterium]|nr:N-acetylmuramoyl-L-alanine amidase [Candidatus Binatota bacterium]